MNFSFPQYNKVLDFKGREGWEEGGVGVERVSIRVYRRYSYIEGEMPRSRSMWALSSHPPQYSFLYVFISYGTHTFMGRGWERKKERERCLR